MLPVFIAVMVMCVTSASAFNAYQYDDVSGESADFNPYVAEGLQNDIYSEIVDLEHLSEVALMAAIDDSYGVGTSNTTIFAGLARKLPHGVNYVYWREGQYQYCFAYGESLTLQGTYFSAEEVETVTYTTATGYGSQVTYEAGKETNFSLNAQDYLVWSNLGHYPALDDGGNIYEQTTLFVLCGACAFYLLSRIMRRCFR